MLNNHYNHDFNESTREEKGLSREDQKDLNLDRDQLPVERACGLQWCVETDSFKFKMERVGPWHWRYMQILGVPFIHRGEPNEGREKKNYIFHFYHFLLILF